MTRRDKLTTWQDVAGASEFSSCSTEAGLVRPVATSSSYAVTVSNDPSLSMGCSQAEEATSKRSELKPGSFEFGLEHEAVAGVWAVWGSVLEIWKGLQRSLSHWFCVT